MRTASPLSIFGACVVAMAAGCRTPDQPPASLVSSARPKASARQTPAARGTTVDVLPFIHDDYPRALAEAKRTGRRLFVDAWAPWCHSCLSMRAYVLTDPQLAPLSDAFVWLALDTEKEGNSKFVEHFPNRVWPTLWVIDPVSESPVLRWESTATAPELASLLATVSEAGRPGAGQAAVTFLKANQAAARGETVATEKGYRAVLSDRTSPDRDRAAEALVSLLSSRHRDAECTEIAITETEITETEGARMLPGTSRAIVLITGLGCARSAKLTAALTTLTEAAERAASDVDPRTAADDRSALFDELVTTKKDQHDEASAKAIAQRWASFLEAEAARATTPMARAVFDPHRVEAYLAAGEPARAVPMLVLSERDFPDDYNPPARLARVLMAMNNLDDAQAAVTRASALVYGPRQLHVLSLAADIAKARRDSAGERAALEKALSHTETSVLTSSQKQSRADLEKRLRDLPPRSP